ncbi:MAG: hypothetical protein JWP37_196 [Mucilaginibacter sp.]|nr:hypothetical protein [Mucilaginibacter sp.]
MYKALTYLIAAVWFVNGFLCKILNLVSRHELIVSRILGTEHAALFTKSIGVAEVLMGVWIISGIKHRLNALVQIVIILTMNVIEFTLAPDLLLWGRANLAFAILFVVLICVNEFALRKKMAK